MKNISLLLVILLSLCLTGCRKKTNLLVQPRTNIETVNKTTNNEILAEETDEFILEDDTDFNVFEDNNKKQIDSKAELENELRWEEVDNNQTEFEKIQFDYDSSTIKPEENSKIKKNAKTIKEKLSKNDAAQVRIKGHSCKIAKNKEHNYVISQERAYNTRKSYINNGVPEGKIKAVGYGDSMPLTNEDDMEAQKVNRRSETFVG